jgi:hypothetical protein
MTEIRTLEDVQRHNQKVAEWRSRPVELMPLHADPMTGRALVINSTIMDSRQARPEYVPLKKRRCRRGVMNRLETAFAQELGRRKDAGEFVWFEFETQKYKLADDAWYTPDFPALRANLRQVVFEVKGFWREAARLRCKVMATRYPHVDVYAVTRNRRREWVYEKFEPMTAPGSINAGAGPRGTGEGE